MSVLIRPAVLADVEGIAMVHVNTWRAAYAGIISADYLSHLSCQRSAQNWQKIIAGQGENGWVMVAVNEEGRVAGFAHGSRTHEQPAGGQYEGEVTALYIAPECQRRGLGRKLIAAAADKLRTAGMNSLVVWVLEANSAARSFYQSLGGKLVGTKEINIGGDAHTVVAYGWQNIAELCF